MKLSIDFLRYMPQPISLSLKIQGRMAELAEGNKNNRKLLTKLFFVQLWKVDKNTKIVLYFDNSKGNFFPRPKSQRLAENQVQNFLTCRGRHLSAHGCGICLEPYLSQSFQFCQKELGKMPYIQVLFENDKLCHTIKLETLLMPMLDVQDSIYIQVLFPCSIFFESLDFHFQSWFALLI